MFWNYGKWETFQIKVRLQDFKTLAVSNIVRPGLVTSVPTFIIEQLHITKKTLFGKRKKKKKNTLLYEIPRK